MTGRGMGGITLIELVIAMAIIGVLAWIAYPRLDAVHQIRLATASRRLAADLRYAQGRSIGERTVHGILFEPAAGRYTVFAPTAARPVPDPADRARPLRVGFGTPDDPAGISIALASFGRTPGVTFDFLGVPRDTAGVELEAPGRVVLRSQGVAETVLVEPGTGKVTIR